MIDKDGNLIDPLDVPEAEREKNGEPLPPEAIE